MKTTLIKFVPAVLIVALLVACAGTPFKWADARQIEAGMTPAQVTQLIGPPYSVTAAGDKVIYTWSYVGVFGSSEALSVVFKNGKVVAPPPIPASFHD